MSEKTVYQYAFSGLYVGTTAADESPLEPGIYLIPANCTETAPPAQWPDDQWPRWNGVAWELITKPQVQQPLSPEQKLAEFLSINPDVMALINPVA
jgi:hypothetical protein